MGYRSRESLEGNGNSKDKTMKSKHIGVFKEELAGATAVARAEKRRCN